MGDLLRDSAAERANFQHFDDTEQRIALGQDAQEMFLDLTPFGVAKDLYGASTGYDVLREHEMTLGERIWCGIAGGLGTAGALFDMFDDIAETVGHYAKRLKNASDPLDDAAAPAVELARRATKGASVTEEGGLNLFKWNHPTSMRAEGWRYVDRFLHLPDQGSVRANWAQNASRLRAEMRSGRPIFDSYVDDAGNLIPTRGFLNMERNLLLNRGWRFSPSTGAWHPPVGN